MKQLFSVIFLYWTYETIDPISFLKIFNRKTANFRIPFPPKMWPIKVKSFIKDAKCGKFQFSRLFDTNSLPLLFLKTLKYTFEWFAESSVLCTLLFSKKSFKIRKTCEHFRILAVFTSLSFLLIAELVLTHLKFFYLSYSS